MTIPRLKVLIAPDKFRPKLSSKRVCQIISSELAKKFITKSIPLADGGEGSLEAIAETIKA
jgi:glycerate kinase